MNPHGRIEPERAHRHLGANFVTVGLRGLHALRQDAELPEACVYAGTSGFGASASELISGSFDAFLR